MSKPLNWRGVTTEAKLLLIGIPVFIWTMLPIYHLFLFAISPKESALGGQLWPDHPTLHSVLGDALVSQGEYEKALESYNKATELAQARSGRA